MITEFPSQNMQERVVFRYLDNLRESGKTNMFGASPWIQEAFEMNRYDANRFLVKWMETFGERYPRGA